MGHTARALGFMLVLSLSVHGDASPEDDSLTKCTAPGVRPAGWPLASRSEAVSTKGMAATAHPDATRAALSILDAGGSAADAAIAANAYLSVVEPMMCGPGGDALFMAWDEDEGRLWGYNGAGRSAAKLDYDTLREELGDEDVLPDGGPLTVTVPGAVRGWCDLHAKLGKLDLSEVLAPAIRAAEEGFPVAQRIQSMWKMTVDPDEVTSGGRYPHALDGFHEIYGTSSCTADATCTAEDRMPNVGELMYNKAMGEMFRRLGEKNGCDDFYAKDGPLARALDNAKETSGVWIDGEVSLSLSPSLSLSSTLTKGPRGAPRRVGGAREHDVPRGLRGLRATPEPRRRRRAGDAKYARGL